MIHGLRRGCLFAAAAFLTACAGRVPAPACIDPTDGIEYCLQGPAALAELDQQLRLVTVLAPGEPRRDTLFAAGYRNNRLYLEASSLLGQPLFRIEQDQLRIRAVPAGRFDKPEWLIGLLQLAYLPLETVRTHSHGVIVDEHVDAAGRIRIFKTGENTAVMRVNYTPAGETIFIHEAETEVRISNPEQKKPGSGEMQEHPRK